ncbi:FAD-dependent oxidoreductase [Albimonas sp. CAU 1670]|uniref:NAD(P)/FAD-dependent oxidoreductase n=1 Tax=Albimonas sp. CAU 1670 TaxID=3032599 RepID=UPI0023DCB188|nr:FAD-dependent oxidoreductase [Albimonas sp. CAU 1670]MDF2231608.1 FAD-dependent oxidoreductase [Albimonas sp. CAU 1670]
MKIAVIGAGISGLGAALALSERHDVHLFEKDARFGGHANTVEVPGERFGLPGPIAVDTGFIVYNRRNYPNLTALFEHLDVPTKWSDMSFGFSLKGGAYEYACDDLARLFAQPLNCANPRHIRMLLEILRFNRSAAEELESGDLEGLSLGDWLTLRGYSAAFRDRFVTPMGGAIWSTSTAKMLEFPASSFVAFFRNHDLMTGLDPAQRWRTVDGGSREYVRRLVQALGPRATLGVGAQAVTRGPDGVRIRFSDGSEGRFDQAILATHADLSLRLMQDADGRERALLGAIRYSDNRAVLHSDPRLMPRRRKVWSSWNFLSQGAEADARRPAEVSYWMNRLQGLPAQAPLFVSLNPAVEPDPETVHGEFSYAHPLFDGPAFEAQSEMDAIQGRGGIWHAGAWLGWGFHEDGLRSGLRAAAALGGRPEWAREVGAPIPGQFAATAAE